MFRSPKTTQERRYSQGDLDWEGLVRVRAKRNHRNLPNAYGDIDRGDWNSRCWKRYRRHQWRPKPSKPHHDSSRYAKHMRRRGTRAQWWGRRPD